MMISCDDPRHVAARKAIDAMHEFWKLAPHRGAVQWIEDFDGRLVVFTRSEYRDAIMEAVAEQSCPKQFFELADAAEAAGKEGESNERIPRKVIEVLPKESPLWDML